MKVLPLLADAVIPALAEHDVCLHMEDAHSAWPAASR